VRDLDPYLYFAVSEVLTWRRHKTQQDPVSLANWREVVDPAGEKTRLQQEDLRAVVIGAEWMSTVRYGTTTDLS
jgi:hypothetical protein